jgi:hypothetical protein
MADRPDDVRSMVPRPAVWLASAAEMDATADRLGHDSELGAAARAAGELNEAIADWLRRGGGSDPDR